MNSEGRIRFVLRGQGGTVTRGAMAAPITAEVDLAWVWAWTSAWASAQASQDRNLLPMACVACRDVRGEGRADMVMVARVVVPAGCIMGMPVLGMKGVNVGLGGQGP